MRAKIQMQRLATPLPSRPPRASSPGPTPVQGPAMCNVAERRGASRTPPGPVHVPINGPPQTDGVQGVKGRRWETSGTITAPFCTSPTTEWDVLCLTEDRLPWDRGERGPAPVPHLPFGALLLLPITRNRVQRALQLLHLLLTCDSTMSRWQVIQTRRFRWRLPRWTVGGSMGQTARGTLLL